MELEMINKNKSFSELLMGNDRRRLRRNHKIIESIHNQETFDELFSLVFHHERTLVMRAVDAVEKITSRCPEYLQPHKTQLMAVLKSADHKELKWHIAQLIPRLQLNQSELTDAWLTLSYWAQNKNESKIVRVNALRGLFEISRRHTELMDQYKDISASMAHEPIPSIQARLRKLNKIKSTTS